MPVAALLSAATPIVRIGMWRRKRQPRVRVNARVISFGNLTVGGTGKTPAVIERARAEHEAGRRVAVVTRGYGSRRIPEPTRLDPGMPPHEACDRFGDEAVLIARRVPGIHVVKAADRVAGARYATDQLGCDTIILDDGFQYLALERNENILVIDATNPFGNGRLLPRGILREPVDAMVRATAITLTRCDQADDRARTVAAIRRICPETPLRLTRHAPDSLRRVADGEAVSLESLRGREIEAACAIGNPDAFFRTLEGLGAVLVSRRSYRDHAGIDLQAGCADRWTVLTEKDAVRVRAPSAAVYALGIALEDME